ncbi:hypothetical protein SAMN03080598_02853 [Algoriphagus boritolerans DSM 17298 = JCM 18970]|uniref:Uncharacterized protein n=1 Tax=Algoriphagus boritolerans DSM 17298 = JCM 18970 TaxID=1120964 RepID=A0A1H5Y6X0_9BACT|nr:hypothetical protein SAMN03080598_02853 [Algoriphagus boritolerans DSM 17298 = JCM 18970]
MVGKVQVNKTILLNLIFMKIIFRIFYLKKGFIPVRITFLS